MKLAKLETETPRNELEPETVKPRRAMKIATVVSNWIWDAHLERNERSAWLKLRHALNV